MMLESASNASARSKKSRTVGALKERAPSNSISSCLFRDLRSRARRRADDVDGNSGAITGVATTADEVDHEKSRKKREPEGKPDEGQGDDDVPERALTRDAHYPRDHHNRDEAQDRQPDTGGGQCDQESFGARWFVCVVGHPSRIRSPESPSSHAGRLEKTPFNFKEHHANRQSQVL